MKKLILILTMIFAISLISAQETVRSGFVDGFDKSKFKEVSGHDEAYGLAIGAHWGGNLNEMLFTSCHHYIAQKIFVNYGDYSEFRDVKLYNGDEPSVPLLADFMNDVKFPKDMPAFTSLRIYYHFDGNPTYLMRIDGWEIVDDVRFTGQKYIATDNLKIRAEPSLNAEKIGLIKKNDYAKILEVGEKVTIDGIESAWVKVRTQDDKEGWCFAGYLTDGTEYRTKP